MASSTLFPRRRTVAAAAVLLAALAPASSVAAGGAQASTAAPSVDRVSVTSTEREVPGSTHPARPAVSRHGDRVVFTSRASNLVPGDTNAQEDVFLRNRLTGRTLRVSLDGKGQQLPSGAGEPTISASGRYVAFVSDAARLGGPATGDRNGTVDVAVRDLKTGSVHRASVRADGRTGNGPSFSPVLSGTGRYVAFQSVASDLVPGDRNGREDVFVRDLRTGTTGRVSLDPAGRPFRGASIEPSISADGRLVVFGADRDQDDHVELYVRDRVTKTTRLLQEGTYGAGGHVTLASWQISGDGRYVAFVTESGQLVRGDTNREFDAFRMNVATGGVKRVSVASGGRQADGPTDVVSISYDGRTVAFGSGAANLVGGDTNAAFDVFLHHVPSQTTRRVSRPAVGQANSDSGFNRDVSLSWDAQHVSFGSFASNLVPADRNGARDVFVWRSGS